MKYKGVIRVPAITLDTLISKYGLPDLIKVDVEGAEDRVINSLHSKVPVVSMEWAAETRNVMHKCIDHLTSLGFTRFFIQNTDQYTFVPPNYPYDAQQCKDALEKTVDKQDWGMVWAT